MDQEFQHSSLGSSVQAASKILAVFLDLTREESTSKLIQVVGRIHSFEFESEARILVSFWSSGG
jgi:hypothetical protein